MGRMRAVVFALPIVFAAGIARADEPNAADRETARIAFADGNKLRDEGNVRGALEKYKAAFALAPTPVTALEVGRAEGDLGQLVEAREVLLRVDSIPARNESPKAQAARAEASAMAAKLASRIPKVSLHVNGPVEAASITIDGVAIPREALSVARVLNPGRHVALAIVSGHTVQQNFDVREGETREVTLDLPQVTTPRTQTIPQIVQPLPQVGSGAGVIAFNTPEDNHAWSLRDPHDKSVCALPCTQSLGFATGYKLVRDDGQSVTVPAGLAVLPGTGAQVTPSGSAGNPVAGWALVGAGGGVFVIGTVVFAATAGSSNSSVASAGVGTFLAGTVVGAIGLTVGFFMVMLSHGPMLIRTDMGMPMRIARGIIGTF
jgi:hypothetical protein